MQNGKWHKSHPARQSFDLAVFASPPVTAIHGILSDGLDLQYGEHQLAKSFLSALALGRSRTQDLWIGHNRLRRIFMKNLQAIRVDPRECMGSGGCRTPFIADRLC